MNQVRNDIIVLGSWHDRGRVSVPGKDAQQRSQHVRNVCGFFVNCDKTRVSAKIAEIELHSFVSKSESENAASESLASSRDYEFDGFLK